MCMDPTNITTKTITSYSFLWIQRQSTNSNNLFVVMDPTKINKRIVTSYSIVWIQRKLAERIQRYFVLYGSNNNQGKEYNTIRCLWIQQNSAERIHSYSCLWIQQESTQQIQSDSVL